MNKPTSLMKRRMFNFLGFFILLMVVIIIINIATVSIVDNQKYQKLADKQQFQSIEINANRGTIYDSQGQILAQSATVYNIFIDPVMLERDIKGKDKKVDNNKKDFIIDNLSKILDVEKEYVKKRADKSSRYEIVSRKVDKLTSDKVMDFARKNKLSCIGSNPDTKRFYPQNELAASVIGFTGFEGHGQYGIEYQYDEYLSGVNGKIISAKDAMGQQMPYRYEQSFEAKNGNNLVLNIDSSIQLLVEKELKKTVSSYNAENRACAIVMNPKTGQILAMATESGFDINNPAYIADKEEREYLETLSGEELKKEKAKIREKQWKNKAITELYVPGSVFKVVTGASALEEKLINKDTTFTCTGHTEVAGQGFNCWKHAGHGTQNFVQAMTNSCNPAFINIGQRLGVKKFSEYFNAFGLTGATGIDLPGEATSIYHPVEAMTKIDLASSSFGQSHKITPIEMITAYAAAVNGGNLVTPYVVDKIVDKNGNVVKQFEPKIRRQVVSEETSKTMREILESVVNNKGGTNAYVKGFRIGGKSGTSQKIDEYGEAGKAIYVGSYVGFAPANDPEVIMLCMVDEPTGGAYYGGTVAAPVVANVFEEILPYLGHFKQYTEDEVKKLGVAVPNVVNRDLEKAKTTIEALQLKVDIIGQGKKVVKQIPSASSMLQKGGKVLLYTEDVNSSLVTVPNVKGKTLQEANIAITNAGLNFMPTGGAANNPKSKATNQSMLGKKVPVGTIIQVEFVTDSEEG